MIRVNAPGTEGSFITDITEFQATIVSDIYINDPKQYMKK